MDMLGNVIWWISIRHLHESVCAGSILCSSQVCKKHKKTGSNIPNHIIPGLVPGADCFRTWCSVHGVLLTWSPNPCVYWDQFSGLDPGLKQLSHSAKKNPLRSSRVWSGKSRSWDRKHWNVDFFTLFCIWFYKYYINPNSIQTVKFVQTALVVTALFPKALQCFYLDVQIKVVKGESRHSVRREGGSIDHYSLITHWMQ